MAIGLFTVVLLVTNSRGYCVTHSIILDTYSLTETVLVTKMRICHFFII